MLGMKEVERPAPVLVASLDHDFDSFTVLDWVYLRLKSGLPVQLNELEFPRLNVAKLLDIAKRFPRSVLEAFNSDRA
jgi:hypothetical protein